MGHRLSRTYWSSTNSGSNNNTNNSRGDTTQRHRQSFTGTNINPEITNHSYSVDNSHFRSGEIPFQTTTVTIPTQNSARSVIIKIQLSKMESDAPIPITTLELPSNSSLSVAQEVPTTSSSTPSSLNNLNRLDNHDQNFNITAMTTQQPVLNVTVTNPVTVDNTSALNQLTEDVKLNNINSQIHSTIISNNNNNNTNFQEINDRVNQFSANISVLSNDGVNTSTSSNKCTNSNVCTNIPNNLNNNTVRGENGTRSNNIGNIIENKVNNVNVCQHQIGNATIRHLPQQNQPGTSSSNVTDGDGQATCCQQKNYPFTSKWAFCECAYRDRVKNFAQFAPNLDVGQEGTVAKGISSGRNKWTNKLNCTKRNDDQSSEENVDEESVSQEVVIPTTSSQLVAGPPCVIVLSVNHSQAPQFVVGSVEDCDERARRQRALEIEQGLEATPGFIPQHQQIISHFRTSQIPPNLPFQQSNILPEFAPAIAAAMAGSNAWHMHAWHGPKVHSQMDFIHCLVPDLDKITSSSFYWGKMDRYEAERLLEGKPEGTFLLRDSAQEEYLFSVTFRKYGRSLHARIEQFNHKFSFDCHDPCVYTARTVTGLLEHYKDPSCVMFFEPMLTIPLHRNFTFSLQQLCRATISSRITYDGIKELHLPNTLKSYLREYHYKLLVRIKPVEELFYSCS